MFIQTVSTEESIKRVPMRASQGGYDVPDEKLRARFERTIANLQRAMKQVHHVIVFSNANLSNPYQWIAYNLNGRMV